MRRNAKRGAGLAHRSFFVCGAIGAACLTAPAPAQERRLDFIATAQILYDSNIARSSRAVAEARGLEQEDVRFTPSLGVEGALPFGRHELSVNALVGADIHAVNSRLDRERIEGRLGLASDFGRCRSLLEATFARRQTDLEDIIIGPVENTETVKGASVGASCPREVGIVPYFNVGIRSTDNSETLRRSVDSDTVSVEGGLSYVQPSLGELGIFVRNRHIEYPNRLVAVGGAGLRMDEVRVRELGVRYTRNVGTLLRGTVSAAYTDVDRLTEEEAFTGLSYLVSLSVRPEARLSGQLTAERKIEPSNRIGISYSLDELYRAEAIYALSPLVGITAGASVRDRTFEPVDSVVPFGPTDEETTTAYASLRVQAHPRILVTLNAQRERRDSNLPLFDYTSTRIGLSTRLIF
jgi:hypothetical protein